MRGKITKEYIVDAVTEMARQNSIITDITVRKIAAHIGCSHPNIYIIIMRIWKSYYGM